MSENTPVHRSPSLADNRPHLLTTQTTSHYISRCLTTLLFISRLHTPTTGLTYSPLKQHHITSQHVSRHSCSCLLFTRRQQASLTHHSHNITSHINMSEDTSDHLSPSPADNRPHSPTTHTASHHIPTAPTTLLFMCRQESR